eukprot:8027410-Alexandrium_andersonii.AAC.1
MAGALRWQLCDGGVRMRVRLGTLLRASSLACERWRPPRRFLSGSTLRGITVCRGNRGAPVRCS